jgi:hypothetical protein
MGQLLEPNGFVVVLRESLLRERDAPLYDCRMPSTLMTSSTALTAAQCRAGRALIEWSLAQLSQSAAIDVQTIADFEKRFRSADETTRRRLRATLEAAGVVFIAENGGGAGARLKFSREEVWEVNRWEDEGGLTGEDDIL